ncbi:MAG TPA: type VI secretion system baseplate subunit TssG, partial [Thermoanaerobaculia bacterium]|nr:type VI secretion system baseplate subunit TssG [Thermoanaerobaculia bacterium]
VSQRLQNSPQHFGFFQAVRLLARLAPRGIPVGQDGPPGREVVRFRTRATLEFPPSEIHDLRFDADDPDRPPQMTVAFGGTTGPLGVLPVPYTELLIERVRYKDLALWEFLDLFNHRFVSLFYRAWRKYRFAFSYEAGGEDPFTEAIYALIGLGTEGLRDRQIVPDEALLFYAGLIAQRPHSTSALTSILRNYFGVPVGILQFVGQWLDLEEGDQSRLGARNSRLGSDFVLGGRVWNNQSRFRVRLGPLGFREFLLVLPKGSAFRPLNELLRFLVGLEYDFDVQPVLKKEEIPACQLRFDAAPPPMLGWTSWLKSRPSREDATELILESMN